MFNRFKFLLILPLVLFLSACNVEVKDLVGFLNSWELKTNILPKDFSTYANVDSAKARELFEKFYAYARSKNINVIPADLGSVEGAWGYFFPEHNLIAINQLLKSDAAMSTLVHELSHACVADLAKEQPFATARELIAEGISLVVLSRERELTMVNLYSIVYILNTGSANLRAQVYRDYRPLMEKCVNQLVEVLKNPLPVPVPETEPEPVPAER